MQYTTGMYLGTEKKKIIECIPRNIPEREKVEKYLRSGRRRLHQNLGSWSGWGVLRKKPLFGSRRGLRNLGIVSEKRKLIT